MDSVSNSQKMEICETPQKSNNIYSNPKKNSSGSRNQWLRNRRRTFINDEGSPNLKKSPTIMDIKNPEVLAFVKKKKKDILKIEKEIGKAIKLTRAKAKEFNQSLESPIQNTTNKSIIELIDEVSSDEEDEDYEPGEDSSSDECNDTFSDIGSQPRTPATPYIDNELITNEFKVPTNRKDSESQTDEEIIARRTRSKLSLAMTAIETIESTFIPPDITTDMYDVDLDYDNIWTDFLTEFSKPINTINEEDDEADPEYIDNSTVNHQEYEHKESFTKKEFSNLMEELCEILMDEYGNVVDDFNDNHTVNNQYQQQQQYQNHPQQQQQQQQNQEQLQQQHQTNNQLQNSDLFVIPEYFTTSTPYHNNYLSDGLINNQLNQSSIQVNSTQSYIMKMHNSYVKDNIIVEILVDDVNNPNNINDKSDDDDDGNNFVYDDKYLLDYSYKNCTNNKNLFTDEQRKMLEQQLRMHVQLCVQGFMQTCAYPIDCIRNSCFTYYEYLEDLAKKLIRSRNIYSSYNIWNLQMGIKFCITLQLEIYSTEIGFNVVKNFILNELKLFKREKANRNHYNLKFPQIIIDKVSNSKVFLYPELLPETLIKPDKLLSYSEFEDFLIAFHLEHYFENIQQFEQLQNNKQKNIPTKSKLFNVKRACNYITENYYIFRKSEYLYSHVLVRKNQKTNNAIKFFFEFKKAPSVKIELVNLDFNKIKPLKLMKVNPKMPELWKKHLKKCMKNYNYNKPTCNEKLEDLINEGLTTKLNEIIEKDQEEFIDLFDYHIINKQNQISLIEQRSSSSGSLSTLGSLLSKNNECTDSLDEIFTNSLPTIELTNNNNNNDVKCEYINSHVENAESNDTSNEIITNPEFVDKFLSLNINIKNTIFDTFECFHKKYNRAFLSISVKRNKVKYFLFSWFKTFHIYMSLLFDFKMNKDAKKVKYEATQSFLPRITTTITTNNIKRLQKTQKANDSGRLLLMKEKEEETEKKDIIYAHNFYDKVEEKLTLSDSPEDFDSFKYILTNFDPKKDTVPDLYYKLETLFLPKHTDLVEVLLTFLLSSHATQIGKFFEHYMLTNMNSFINKLNIYYSKQPSQISKIFLCLKNISNEQNLTMDYLKRKIIPLIKGNQILIDWFLQLFPKEKPPDSTEIEYETISLKRLEEDNNNTDVYENIPPTEIFSDPETSSCSIKYLHGRIFYGNRILLPGNLSFACNKWIDENVPKSNKENDNSLCVHDIKEFGEKKINELFNNYSDDAEMNSSHSSDEIDGIDDNSNEPNMKKRKITETTYKLCDSSTLMGHSVRLNPIYHANRIETPIATSTATSTSWSIDNTSTTTSINNNANDDSPKKNTNNKTTSKITKKNNSSPSTSKKLNKSSLTSTAVNLNKKIDDSCLSDLIHRKKLNISTNQNDQSSDDDGKIIKTNKIQLVKKEESSESSDCCVKIKKLPKKRKIRRKKIRKSISPSTVDDNKNVNTVEWSREEDKIILETIEKYFDNETEIIKELLKLFDTTKRDKSDIIERYKFVMNILQPVVIPKEDEIPIVEWSREEDSIILKIIESGIETTKIIPELMTVITNRDENSLLERYLFLLDLLKQYQTSD